MRLSTKQSRGFSLIEMMVTAAVVGVGLTAVLVAISGTLKAEARVEQRSMAQDLMRVKVDEFSGATEPASPRTGTFDAPYEGFSWRVEVRPTNNDGLLVLQTEVSWKGVSRTARLRSETLVPQR